MNANLLLSTILMLKKSILKDYLFKIMTNLNKLEIQTHFNNDKKYILNEDTIEDINMVLNNMDSWIRNYNSEKRMAMNRELSYNLKELVKEFEELLNNFNHSNFVK